MTREEFRELVKNGIVLLDGATGTNLQKRGMPSGVCPEEWILNHREILIDLQKEYIEAGSNIIYAPTFSGNRIKLEEYGLAEKIESMNRELVRLSKEAAGGRAYVAGDLTMTGEQLYPIGTLTFEELVDIYKEQISYMLMEGVDLFIIETMMSLSESRAALLAVKETCDLPVMVSLTFTKDLRTLYGTDPATAMVVLQSMGADAVGVNCSTGSRQMSDVISLMKKVAAVPIIGKPNAGLPKLQGDETVYNMEPDEFAEGIKRLVECGAGIVGGCCGTTPLHIKALKDILKTIKPLPVSEKKPRVLTSERKTLEIDLDGRLFIVGERINPTGKKALQEELRQGKLDLVNAMAVEQAENGADILDINMGMNGINEKEMLLKTVYEMTKNSELPLCIDSSYSDVIEEALRIYPGRALINSVSLEKEKMKRLIPCAKKYGAMFILLPVSETGLPKDMEEKKQIISTIVDAALKEGLTREDIVVDGLVNTIGANKNAAFETLATIRFCKEELGVATIIGLSNISFGLPGRQFINSTFLALAIQEGLTMAIGNPSQDLLMNTAFAADLLMNKEGSDLRYINRVTSKETVITSKKEERHTIKEEKKHPIYEAVIQGNRNNIVELVKGEIEKGTKPSDVVDHFLIPGINEVGNLFEKQIYFLPQLISSAETMKAGIEYLEPLLEQGEGNKKAGTIVIATVSGDIHDIGKNLVVLMLKNYGFDVIDLGKDVPTEQIIHTAKEKDADIIALSALMTTTMIEMKTVVRRAKEEGLRAKIIIGGAVITKSYAAEIGADGYAKDAGDTVKVAKELIVK